MADTMLTWDNPTERLYETGVEKPVLYLRNSDGTYAKGVAWNGMTAFNITPSGAEPTKLYANNKTYLTMMSAEEVGATIEAYMYPDEWNACDGYKEIVPGVYAGQQTRQAFGVCVKTLVGNDAEFNKHGYKLHLLYNGLASPSEKAYASVNDTPEANTFSWEVTTTPENVGVTLSDGSTIETLAYICIDSTTVDKSALAALEAILYSTGETGTLPAPKTVFETLGWTAPAAG